MEARRLRDEFTPRSGQARLRRPRAQGRRATFGYVASEWLYAASTGDVGELAPRTLDGYDFRCDAICPRFGSRPIRGSRRTTLSPGTPTSADPGQRPGRSKEAGTRCAVCWAHAVRHGHFAGNPADALTARQRPKPGGSNKRFLIEERCVQSLTLRRADTGRLSRSCCFSGLRISEALGLVWGDVDLRRGHLRVRHQLSRNGQARTRQVRQALVATWSIMDALARDLRRHQLARRHSMPSDFVFATASGSALSARNAGRALGRSRRSQVFPE